MRILIVEDDADLRDSLAELLEFHGHETSRACNGQDALDNLHRAVALPDVILLDLMMPVMDGWAFRAAQRQDPRICAIPVVVFTAVGKIERRAQLGDVQILYKPITSEDLLATVLTPDASHTRLRYERD